MPTTYKSAPPMAKIQSGKGPRTRRQRTRARGEDVARQQAKIRRAGERQSKQYHSQKRTAQLLGIRFLQAPPQPRDHE